jgi:hypothetical protein
MTLSDSRDSRGWRVLPMSPAVLPGPDTIVECWRALTRLSAGARVHGDSATVAAVFPSWTP